MFTLNCHRQPTMHNQQRRRQQRQEEERHMKVNYEKIKLETSPRPSTSSNPEAVTDLPLKPSTSDKTGCIEILRERPEVMLHVYSYLPVKDRVYQLALVDKAFHQDKARSGFILASLGPLKTLSDVRFYLENWVDRLTTELGQLELNIQADDIPGLIERVQRVVQRIVNSIDERHALGEPYFEGHDHHWLSQSVLMEARRHTNSGEFQFHAIGNLLREEGLQHHLETYLREYYSRGLDPGCKLLLPNIDGGWEGHFFRSCSLCSQMKHKYVTVSCSHWTADRCICHACDNGVRLHSSPNNHTENRCKIRRAISCDECYCHDLQIILGIMDRVYTRMRGFKDVQCLVIDNLSALARRYGGTNHPQAGLGDISNDQQNEAFLMTISYVIATHETLSDEIADLNMRLKDVASIDFDDQFARYLKRRTSTRMGQLIVRKTSVDELMAEIVQRKVNLEMQDKAVSAE